MHDNDGAARWMRAHDEGKPGYGNHTETSTCVASGDEMMAARMKACDGDDWSDATRATIMIEETL
jgi:hypothetical protein